MSLVVVTHAALAQSISLILQSKLLKCNIVSPVKFPDSHPIWKNEYIPDKNHAGVWIISDSDSLSHSYAQAIANNLDVQISASCNEEFGISESPADIQDQEVNVCTTAVYFGDLYKDIQDVSISIIAPEVSALCNA